jgi:predicted RNase H-like nuclease
MFNPGPSNEQAAVGVDGCRGGWVAIDGQGHWMLSASFLEILSHFSNHRFFIDIPIGLSGTGRDRVVEDFARPLLGRRASSLFTPPCREAVYAESYQEANRINRSVCRKGISIQCWNIVPRIREMDTLLREKPHLKDCVFEAHPELSFVFFNHNKPLSFSKKTAEGRQERLNLLINHNPDYEGYFQHGRRAFSSTQASSDDLIDALCLTLLGNSRNKQLMQPLMDAEGIPMNLVLPA